MGKRCIGLMGCFFLYVLSGCDRGVEPEQIKHPREYSWTVDTLAYPGSFQTAMRDIWASSPTDVYVVGHNDGPGPGTMFHFDGKSWKTTGFHAAEGGSVAGPVSLSAIHGFAANDIWVVGERIYQNPNPPPNFLDSSLIIHFDGAQWREHKVSGGRRLGAIWGKISTQISAAGRERLAWQFQEGQWMRDSIPVFVPSDGLFQINSLTGISTSELYALGNTHQNTLAKTTYYFFRKGSNGWVIVDSFVVMPELIERKWGISSLWVDPEGRVYSVGAGVFRWNGTRWEAILSSDDSHRGILGVSVDNFFVVGDFGKVMHFNGFDWFVYKQFLNDNVVYSSVWTDGKETFIVGRLLADGTKTIILHGK